MSTEASVGATRSIWLTMCRKASALADQIAEGLGFHHLFLQIGVVQFELGLEPLDFLECPASFFFALPQGLIGGLEFSGAFLHSEFQRVRGRCAELLPPGAAANAF